MLLIGFIIGMYHDARSCECQIRTGMFFSMKVCLLLRILFADSRRERAKNTRSSKLIYAKRVQLPEVRDSPKNHDSIASNIYLTGI